MPRSAKSSVAQRKAREPHAINTESRSAAAAAPANARPSPTLGGLLSALRARNRWTLKQMSERVGIPVSTLSKVERDLLTLTYDKLQLLGERLGLRMSELFAEPEEDAAPDRITGRRSIGRMETAIHVGTKNYDYRYLFPELRRKRMIPILATVRARTLLEFGPLVRHSGEEFFYVVSGSVEVHTEFYDPVRIDSGESIYIDSNMGHAYLVAPGCEEATIIGACASGEPDQASALLGLHGVVKLG